jgi:hypothetical protein
MRVELKQHLEAVGAPPKHELTSEAEAAGWNAACNIEDYLGWCVAGYYQKLNMYGKPYITEADNDPQLTEQLTELYETTVSLNGLRTVRFSRPDLDTILAAEDYTHSKVARKAYLREFYNMMAVWHHHPMDDDAIGALLGALPPQIKLIAYQAPSGLRTNLSSEGFICEEQDPVPSRLRPFGQRGAGRVERPHKDYSYSADMVTRISKQIVHLVTNRSRFTFDMADGMGYVPDRPLFDDESSEEVLRQKAWEGWENQPWLD